jgi:transcriptional regulator with XRE-family HTH domain
MARKIIPLPFPASPEIGTLQELGAFVRAQRTQANLRIDDAAALCGVSVELLSDLEAGRRPVGLDKVLKVMQQMGLALLVVPRTELPRVLHRIETTP